MDPLAALNILDQMARRAPGTRDDHVIAAQAVGVLERHLKAPPTATVEDIDLEEAR